MQRHVRRLAGWWKSQWNTQESIHSIRKWTQPHTHIHAHRPMQESSVHTWTPCSSLVSAEFRLWPVKLKALVGQSCPTLWDLMDCSPPGSSVHGILQARVLEWVAIPSSRGSSWPRDRIWVSWIAVDSLPSEPLRKPQYTKWYYTSTYI